MKPWLKPSDRSPDAGPSGEFWSAMREDRDALDFWSERIAKFSTDPPGRLESALKNLPMPTAFREAAAVMRGIIRQKRKDNQPYEQELAFLYWLGAIRSFDTPDSVKLTSAVRSLIQFMPAKVVLNLTFEYDVLGYEKLQLLNKRDAKWLIEMWGKPQGHSTLYEIHRPIWNAYEAKLQEARMARVWTQV
jgi:hypothetical protein